ncbi:hypothetical protein N1078_12485 [Pseudomonas sp. MIL19]|uniref:hypothetical protein n=1 Tax=Pseudomonas sp. MIL19 TaxID=2976979 RepID=UPI00236470B8|nr:hypothetical protein [Pseudomonas sp. MIL19]MDD2161395.1 hypothetical protein [Pseudomonas sp. MIL19]
MEIAVTALGDLDLFQDAISEVHAVFSVIMDVLPENCSAHALAQLGYAACNDWSEKVYQWAECMEDELDELEVQEGGSVNTSAELGELTNCQHVQHSDAPRDAPTTEAETVDASRADSSLTTEE